MLEEEEHAYPLLGPAAALSGLSSSASAQVSAPPPPGPQQLGLARRWFDEQVDGAERHLVGGRVRDRASFRDSEG